MANYTVARGTRDILAFEKQKESIISDIIKIIASTYGYEMIETPIFEATELFSRSVGESSDIVNKEMYTFLDKGNRSITLRPEGTAGTIRLFVNNKLYNNPDLPVKMMYLGPVFRYERPQSGRYRQFKQFGFECVGLKNPYVDVELILMVKNILESLGFENLEIKINTLGDNVSRNNYIVALKEYFKPYLEGENALCPDCLRRYEQNPLRILDCKYDDEHIAIKNAPKINDYLSQQSKDYFSEVLKLLEKMNVNYVVDTSLVRGLDYYNDVVFEIYQKGSSFGALGAGGRYDNLVNEVGGPAMPATGFAFGIERLLLAMEQENLFDTLRPDTPEVYVMPMGEKCNDLAFKTTEFLRKNGFIVEMDYLNRSFKSQFKTIERKSIPVAIIIGEDELKNNNFIVKDTRKVEQYIVEEEDLLDCIKDVLGGNLDDEDFD